MSTASKEDFSVWSSVNNMLIQNRCWFCREVFVKGKMKKVFQVSDVINFLVRRKTLLTEKTILDDEVLNAVNNQNISISSGSIDIPSNIIYLNEWWERFLFLEENLEKVAEELSKMEVAMWMSGLACCRSSECEIAYNMVMNMSSAGNAVAPISTSSNRKELGNCPPDCGCDNPWPFLSSS
jgi:hypothetical protein